MKKILVPIDFSDTSLNAFFTANRLADKIDAKIDVVHIYSGSVHTNQGMTYELVKTNEEVLLERLRNFINAAPSEGGTTIATNVECKTYLAYNTSSKLSKLSKDYDFVVMGMIGKHSIGKKLVGSIASYVAQHAYCPVLLIPRTYHFKGIEHIVYTRNWESIDNIALNSVLHLAKKFYATIHFLHVNEQLDIINFSLTEQEVLIDLLESNSTDVPYHIINVDSASPKKGIEAYAHDKKVDLIVLVNRQNHLFDNLLKRSLTKEMVLHSDIPLLVYAAKN